MVKHPQIIRRQFSDELFECVDHFVGLALKGLRSMLSLFLYSENIVIKGSIDSRCVNNVCSGSIIFKISCGLSRSSQQPFRSTSEISHFRPKEEAFRSLNIFMEISARLKGTAMNII